MIISFQVINLKNINTDNDDIKNNNKVNIINVSMIILNLSGLFSVAMHSEIKRPIAQEIDQIIE